MATNQKTSLPTTLRLMADDPHKQALAALAKCIAAANVGETVLETDECKSFPDDSIESAP